VRSDERGVVLVLALPLAMVLVFAFWHLARVGELVLERERAQDAADAVAFESALLHARGMNALALLASVEETADGRERTLVRELAQKVSSVVPVLATVAAVEDNAAFYARPLISASHALFPSDIDRELGHNAERPWAFERRSSAHRLGVESSLPVVRHAGRLRMWPEAENGSAMLQVWGWAQPREGEPALAQAEYYFACAAEWSTCEPRALASLDWTARMRRVWPPELKLREHDPVAHAIAESDEQLRPLLPEAPRVAALFQLLAAPTARWMH
jgi:hypothetical protein